MSGASRAALVERVGSFRWVHSIDLGDGVVTKGEWGPPSSLIRQAFDSLDFRDKRVLDIGCWDGLWSFEAERRGAREVQATDCVSQRWGAGAPTLLTAREILGSSIRYDPDVSVFDLPARFPERDFDIVLFMGVYYHLKDPLLALARIPTTRCLREWVECSYFAVRTEHTPRPEPWSPIGVARRARRAWRGQGGRLARMALTAEAVERTDRGYHYLDPEFADFDLRES